MTLACEHPEDRLEPLPYVGKPPDPDEWECLDCGHWEMRDVVPAKALAAADYTGMTPYEILATLHPVDYLPLIDAARAAEISFSVEFHHSFKALHDVFESIGRLDSRKMIMISTAGT